MWLGVYRYVSWHRDHAVAERQPIVGIGVPEDVVMIETKADVRRIAGISNQERTHCPRKAQRILQRYVYEGKQRGVLYRDGAFWVVLAGPELGLPTAVDAVDTDVRSIHYMRQGSPHVVQQQHVDRGLDQLVASPNSAVHPTALLTDVVPVQRYVELAAALSRDVETRRRSADGALEKDVRATERRYLLVNGQNDPAFYVIRTQKDHPNPVLSAPTLPGTLYRPHLVRPAHLRRGPPEKKIN